MIIGQEKLVGEVSKIFKIFLASEGKIKPHFILAGSTGSGKTHTIKTLCEEENLGFFEINAAQLTREGVSGNSLSKALSPIKSYAGKECVVFVDEFDKLFGEKEIEGDTSSSDVQNEFLKTLESETTMVFGDYGKYVKVDIRKILFVFGGVFETSGPVTISTLKELGVKTEFLGRVNLIYNTEKLSLEDLGKILETLPLLDEYLKIFDKIKKDTVVRRIKEYLERVYDKNTLGARAVSSLVNQYFIKSTDFPIRKYEESDEVWEIG